MLSNIKERVGFAIFMQLFILLWFLGVIFSTLFTKIEIHQNLNAYHSAFLDFFFQIITFLGDGIFAITLSTVVFFAKGKKEGILLLLTFLISALLAQFFKNFVFTDAMRPYYYLQAGEIDVATVEGVKLHLNHSFPSGHTTTIFALCSMFSFFYNSKKIGFILLVVAIITAYSRIYLSQHFLEDTLAGAFLGVTTSALIFIFLNQKIRFNTNNSIEK